MNGAEPRPGHAPLPPPSGGAGWLRRYLPLFVLLAAALVVYVMGWHRYLTLQQLAENREALGAAIEQNYFRSLLIYAAIYVVAVALSLPGGALLTLAGGFLFGWLVGGTVTVAAATVGAALIFLVAKTSVGEALAARAGPWLGKLRAGFQENALSYLLFLRLVPLFPFWLVNLAPALLGVPLGTYLVGTFIGIIPGTFAFSYAGVGLDSLIDAQQRVHEECLRQQAANPALECHFSLDPSALVTKELLIAFAALGAVALLPVLLKKLRKTGTSA